MADVKFVRTTKQKQIDRGTYDINALYFTKDSHEIYRAEKLLTDGLRYVNTFQDLPNFEFAADGKIYFVLSTGKGYVINPERNQWLIVIYTATNNIDAVEEIDAHETILTVTAAKELESSLKKYVKEQIEASEDDEIIHGGSANGAQVNTIIVLRNDTKEAWEAEDSYILQSGEVGVGYITRTLENGTTKQVPIMKLGDGTHSWPDLPQAEGVFEQDVILTSAFGRHTIPSTGYKNAGGAGMTTSEWLLDALSEVKDPTVIYPTASLGASFTMETDGTGEVGTYLISAKATGSFTDGKYQYGTNSNKTANSKANTTCSWEIKNKDSEQISTTNTGTVTFAEGSRPQLTESASTYAFSAIATLAPAAEDTYVPLNNVGAEAEHKKITGFDANGTNPKNLTATASKTGYRKPFWGWKDTANSLGDPETITAAQIRALNNSGSSVGGLPTSLNLGDVEAKQLYFAAKAGTKISLTIKNVTKEPATTVACTKVPNAVLVPGANDYGWDAAQKKYTTEAGACSYDLWYVNLDAPLSKDTSLTLEWK